MIDMLPVAGFDWDDGNHDKCQRHGVSIVEIETLFRGTVVILPDEAHSVMERRFKAVGKTEEGRHVFIVFALRAYEDAFYIRPISARYMHRREIESYEEENPDL
jgi:hypothetical protein